MRKPGGSKLVYNRKKMAIEKVTINRFKRFLWYLSYIMEAIAKGNGLVVTGFAWNPPKEKYKKLIQED